MGGAKVKVQRSSNIVIWEQTCDIEQLCGHHRRDGSDDSTAVAAGRVLIHCHHRVVHRRSSATERPHTKTLVLFEELHFDARCTRVHKTRDGERFGNGIARDVDVGDSQSYRSYLRERTKR